MNKFFLIPICGAVFVIILVSFLYYDAEWCNPDSRTFMTSIQNLPEVQSFIAQHNQSEIALNIESLQYPTKYHFISKNENSTEILTITHGNCIGEIIDIQHKK